VALKHLARVDVTFEADAKDTVKKAAGGQAQVCFAPPAVRARDRKTIASNEISRG
jgi:hypothetical protein